MKPYFQTAGITIYHADCRAVLPGLAEASIDAVITDPPYGISYRSSSRKMRPDLPATVEGDESLNRLRDSLPLIDRALKADRHAYIFAAPMKIGEAVDAIAEYWRVKNVLVWDKGNAGSKGDCLAGYSVNWEAIVYANKGRRPLNGKRPRCIYRYDWQAWRDPVHPTVKPEAIMQWMMEKSSSPGELILDPFMGSGVTLLAAAALGRQAVGVEVEERYCEVAAKRLLERASVMLENNPTNPTKATKRLDGRPQRRTHSV